MNAISLWKYPGKQVHFIDNENNAGNSIVLCINQYSITLQSNGIWYTETDGTQSPFFLYIFATYAGWYFNEVFSLSHL